MGPRFTPEQIRERLDAVRNCDLDAARAELDAQLAAYERHHGMSTEVMRRSVVSGEIEETDELCRWLMVHNRKRIVDLLIAGATEAT